MSTQGSNSALKPNIVIIRSGGYDVPRKTICGDTVELYGSSEKNVDIDIKDQDGFLISTRSDNFGTWKVLINLVKSGQHRFVAGDKLSGTVSEEYEVGNPVPGKKDTPAN